MTVTLFVTILSAGAALSALLTEAIKKAYSNAKKEYSANIIALINSIVVGGLGTAVAYLLLDIPWTVNNIVCLVCAIFVEWLMSMTSFDKIMQLLEQVSKITNEETKK